MHRLDLVAYKVMQASLITMKFVVLGLELRVTHICFTVKLYLSPLYHFLSFLINVFPACQVAGRGSQGGIGDSNALQFGVLGYSQGSSNGCCGQLKPEIHFQGAAQFLTLRLEISHFSGCTGVLHKARLSLTMENLRG